MPRPAGLIRYFNSSPEVIRLVVLMYVHFPLSMRNVADWLFERGIDICHGTVGIGGERNGRFRALRWRKRPFVHY